MSDLYEQVEIPPRNNNIGRPRDETSLLSQIRNTLVTGKAIRVPKRHYMYIRTLSGKRLVYQLGNVRVHCLRDGEWVIAWLERKDNGHPVVEDDHE